MATNTSHTSSAGVDGSVADLVRDPVSDGLIDWDFAAATANRLLRSGSDITVSSARMVVAELKRHAADAEGHVTDFTGLVPAGETPVLVVDRPSWVQANLDGFQVVLRPLLGKVFDRRTTQPAIGITIPLGAKVLAVELGSVLAFLATRVLGQYETFAFQHGAGQSANGRLLIVAPNVVRTERDMNVNTRDFRLWVCLHEQTHRLQFTAVPWLRQHLADEVASFLTSLDVDPLALARQVKDAARAVTNKDPADAEGELAEVAQTPIQRDRLSRLIALMTLLEGHAEYVMDGVGPAVIPSVREIREKFQQRRAGRGWWDAMLRRLLGLDLKLRQYQEGEHFVRAVVDRVGMAGFNQVWTSPATLPSRAEIRDPNSWVARVHSSACNRAE